MTATHMIILSDDISMVQILLDRRGLLRTGSEPEPNPLEGTALAIAAFFGNLPILNILMDHGIKPSLCIFLKIICLQPRPPQP